MHFLVEEKQRDLYFCPSAYNGFATYLNFRRKNVPSTKLGPSSHNVFVENLLKKGEKCKVNVSFLKCQNIVKKLSDFQIFNWNMFS